MLPPQRSLSRSFNRAADSYDATAFLQKEVGQRLFERLEMIRLQPEVIVDLGSGTGLFTRSLEKRYPKADVLAVDIADNMLRTARRKKSFFTRQHFICADAFNIPLADHSVDLIFSNLVFHWCENKKSLFAELKRILKPNGLLLFSMFGVDTLRELREIWGNIDDKTHINTFLDLHDVGDFLSQNKFRDSVMDRENITLSYQDIHGFLHRLKASGSFNQSKNYRATLTGKERWKKFISAYTQTNNSAEKFLATFEILYGHAWNFITYDDREITKKVLFPLSKLKKTTKNIYEN
jgi:malonyl-CoA O-methyltransferase